METLRSLEKWHTSTPGLVVFAIGEGLLAYLFASLAIPSAHTWEWVLAAVFGIGTLQNVGRIILKLWQKLTSKQS